MRRLLLIAMVLPLSAAVGSPSQRPALTAPPAEIALRQARADAARADAQAAQLDQAATRARGEAAQLRVRETAAAQGIAAAEARITAATVQLELAAEQEATQRQQLRARQQPAASLLAGIAMMAQRPPLLAIADSGGSDELIRVRVLLDATLPVIHRRTAALAGALARARADERATAFALAALGRSREELAARKASFAALETRALQLADRSGGQALSVGDVALAAGERAEQLAGTAQSERSAAVIAAQIAVAPPIPPRPGPADGETAAVPFAYQLPSAAPVSEGLGTVSASGVRSRGVTLATARSAPLLVPAAGIVRFAGPFRDYDGVIIIDHGGGWLSMVVNAATDLHPGDRVGSGDRLGRALGPIEVELSRGGQRLSPAIIAGSSPPLSKPGEGR